MRTPHKTKYLFQGPALAALMSLALAGCSGISNWNTGDMPSNYQARHPISLEPTTQSTTIAVSVAGAGINSLQHSQIEAFAREFRQDGEGAMAINIPVGGPNERQAANVSRDIRQIMMGQGLPQQSLVYRPYKAGPGAAAPPVLLSYRRTHATVNSTCGVIENLDINYKNEQYQDFGCSTQTNFAAMLANPNDLVSPRPMDNASAARRSDVLGKFNKGSKTATGTLTGGTTAGSGSN